MPSDSGGYLVVGVTGGIGSGKSTVCEVFERLGRTVLRADAIAHDVTQNDRAVITALADVFGREVLNGDGSINRRALAARAFADEPSAAKLNSIVHPPVFERIAQLLAAMTAEQKQPYVLIDAALIFETGMDEWLDRIIVVEAPEDVRIARVMERDGRPREDILQRMAYQIPDDLKRARADMVIVNDKNAVALDDKVKLIDLLLRALPAEA